MRQHRLPIPGFTAALALTMTAGALTQATAAQAALSARDIMEKVTVTRKVDGSEAVVKMTIVGDKGQTREREIAVATKVFDGGKTEKRVSRFLSPADVQGTAVLVFDYESKADDVWIYLPAMRKTRRIVSSQGSQSFMGSEFTYSDLNIPALDDFNYTLGKEEPCGAGETCWVIDVLPKSKETADSEGYSKKTYWVTKDKFTAVRGLMYDKDGKLLKELVQKDFKLLDPKNKRYRPMQMEMTNKQNGRRSTFEFKKMSFMPNTKDDYFTTSYLERAQ
ncbi:MAG TPA: outer membrane lipoprotein-sorting protein [Polyangia bacterium]|jgi:outer membrane lipoprotein-sorting protein